MELSKVTLEKSGDCHVKRAPRPHNLRILLRPFPSCSTKLQAVPEHRIICVIGHARDLLSRLLPLWWYFARPIGPGPGTFSRVGY
jgi:hypothetical protein